MPKPQLPLTPAASTEIAALDKCINSPGEMYFTLPPSAMSNSAGTHPTPFPPLSPTSPEATQSSSRTLRQRSSTKRPAADFTLPPPPTRTRKIIQVKPKGQEQPRTAGTQAKGKDGQNASTDGPGSKKKQSNATTAAGRKIARRTAHSLIERRRRSKMNEEFATLKNMIPACQGQEMHKLAILQASIEYVNYLEQCIVDLKAANNRRDSTPTSPTWNESKEQGTALSSYTPSPEFNPQFEPPVSLSQTASPRPSGDVHPRSSHASSFEIIPMILPSPALPPSKTPHFPPRVHRDTLSSNTSTISSISNTSAASSTTSPIIPQQTHDSQAGKRTPSLLGNSSQGTRMDVDMDREATTALLMLNIDRRTSSGGADMLRPAFLSGNSDDGGKKGISVQDLLSH
ncbi:predicted protein [Uncinocarpus reesii 1704]|uniref:BHLH domain-containing protein n=1 Tax=Uncinocarpus reesii (strain UAMH 1704) TaxID=336963 RepID=C4JTR2_UNCRE|nr:uncharacterized protein UREG_05851 [Uncinocarpus reesii 1704]EEP81009.1 predicted protein [Uncinocarpus reesii 1704]